MRSIALGYPFISTRRLLKKTEFVSYEALTRLQESQLDRLLRFAIRNIPFYREVSGSGLSEGDTTALLKRFPLIDKKLVRGNLGKFMKGGRVRSLKATSGGSTGEPFVFYMDRLVTRQREKAFIFDQWGRVGYRLGDKVFNLRGRMPQKGKFVSRDPLFNIYYASSLDLCRKNIDAYASAMNSIRPDFLHGYPSTMYQLALLLESTKGRLNFGYRAVFCGSEKLFDYQRRKIEEVFGCSVYHWYGQSECLALGGECERSHALHFYPQYGYCEFIPAGVKDESGKELFEIVATGFNNRIMPLIRYRTGDYALLSDSTACTCGRNYILVDEVVGREQEFVVDANGSVISATSLIFGQHFDAFEGLESIKLKQERPGKMEIVLVKGEAFRDELLKTMMNKLEALIGARMLMTVSFSDHAERTAIGKAKLVEQRLDLREYLYA